MHGIECVFRQLSQIFSVVKLEMMCHFDLDKNEPESFGVELLNVAIIFIVPELTLFRVFFFLHTKQKKYIFTICQGFPNFTLNKTLANHYFLFLPQLTPARSSNFFLPYGCRLVPQYSDCLWMIPTGGFFFSSLFCFVLDVSAKTETWNDHDPSNLKGWFMTAVLALCLFLV